MVRVACPGSARAALRDVAEGRAGSARGGRRRAEISWSADDAGQAAARDGGPPAPGRRAASERALAGPLGVGSTGCIEEILLNGQMEGTRQGAQAMEALSDHGIAQTAAYSGANEHRPGPIIPWKPANPG